MNLQESIRRILEEETDSVKNLNESKTPDYNELIYSILERFKEEDCICDTRVSFDVEENYYDIYLVFSQEELHDKFSNVMGIRNYITEMMNDVKKDLEAFLPIRNIFIGYYTKPNCEWSPLNESEDDKEKNLNVLRELISMFDYSEVCDMWVEYEPEDGYYAIRSKMSTKNHNTKALEKEFEFLEESIKSLGLKAYISHPYWVEECGDENELNESKKEKNYISIIEKIVEPFKEDVGVCDIDLWYDDEDDMYSVYLVFGTEELNDKFTSDGKFGYVRKKQKEVEETIKSYLPIKNIRVGSYGTPYCGWKSLNESEDKNQSLLSLIEEHGLYEFMKMTGLSLPQIYTKIGELPREVFERFIKDFIKQEGYPSWMNGTFQLIFTVEIQKNIQIEQFYIEGDKVILEISEYNDYGKQTDGYIESLSNLTDDEIFTIVENMIKWITYSEM